LVWAYIEHLDLSVLRQAIMDIDFKSHLLPMPSQNLPLRESPRAVASIVCGSISLFIGMITGVMLINAIRAGSDVYSVNRSGWPRFSDEVRLGLGIFGCVSFLLNILGMGLGIGSMTKNEPYKSLGIAGLIFCSLEVFCWMATKMPMERSPFRWFLP